MEQRDTIFHTDLSFYSIAGRILRTYRFSGEVVIELEWLHPAQVKPGFFFFLPVVRKAVPYAVEKAEATAGDRIIVKFEDVNTEEEAGRITGLPVYLPADEKIMPAGAGYSFLNGFDVFDESRKENGRVMEVMKMPGHEVARLDWQGMEVLLPLNGQTVIRSDRQEKKVWVRFPEGLLEVYLQKGKM